MERSVGRNDIHIPNSVPAKVLSFVRQNETEKAFAVINFSNQPQTVTFKGNLYPGAYTEYLSGQQTELNESTKLQLKPWDYQVFVK